MESDISSGNIGSRARESILEDISRLEAEIKQVEFDLNNSEIDELESDPTYDIRETSENREVHKEEIVDDVYLTDDKVKNIKTETKRNLDEEIDDLDILFPKQKPKYSDYIPISMRINEMNERKSRKINELKEAEDIRFHQECTFHPDVYVNTQWKPKKTEREDREKKDDNEFLNRSFMCSASRRIIKAIEREKKKRLESGKEESPTSPKTPIIKTGRKLTPKEQKKSIERLLASRKVVVQPEEELNMSKMLHRSNPGDAERLFIDGISKQRNIEKQHRDHEDNKDFFEQKQYINKNSEKIAQNYGRASLFDDSISRYREICQKKEELTQFYKDAEMKECTFRPEKLSSSYCADNFSKADDKLTYRKYSSMIVERPGKNAFIRFNLLTKKSPKKKTKEVIDDEQIDSVLKEVDRQFSYIGH